MKEKYDIIGLEYNQTRKADPHIAQRLHFHLHPKPNNTYLDIGCGTGNYTHTLYQKEWNIIGIDPSREMLTKARLKNANIDWRIGTAEQTGLVNQSIDGILGSLTIHHWANLEMAFQELTRVLKPKGAITIFTSTPLQMKGYWLNHYFPKMLEDSLQQMPAFERIEKAMVNAGLKLTVVEKYYIQEDLQDLFLYCGKYQPERYLNPIIRKGISSFSSLANLEEVNMGLTLLEKDIKNRQIEEIMKNYDNDLGDYLFIKGNL